MSNVNDRHRDPSTQLPVGFDDFGEIIENKLNFVDKTLFIKEVLDDINTKVMVITRPRRFGKTFNLSMLEHFLAPQVRELSTQGMFDGLKIAECGNDYMQHQGKYPVIAVTFKGIKASDFNLAYEKLCELIIECFDTHNYLLASEHLSDRQKSVFKAILKSKANQAQIENALKTLTECLFAHYKTKPFLLIDEYDTPIQSAYASGYYAEMMKLMREIFGAALKNNAFLGKGVVTGILRIAKESLFSDVNNLKIYSMLSQKYSEYFGFVEEEVQSLLKKANLFDRLDEVRQWYNGYQFGNNVIYNPWSIANYLDGNGLTEPYWINTSDNQLIKNLLKEARIEIKQDFETLIMGGMVEKLIDEHVVFNYLGKDPSAIWSLLLLSGYLKQTSAERTHQGVLCHLAIPNREVRDLFRRIIEQWLSDGYGLDWYNEFIESLLVGRMDDFKKHLEKIMLQIVSYHDSAQKPEAFYHGLMLGFTVSLHHRYEIKSNRESGLGRFDIMLIPNDKSKLGIVLELKIKEKNETLTAAAKRALAQIEENKYAAEFAQRNIARVLKIGIGFAGKEFDLCFNVGSSC